MKCVLIALALLVTAFQGVAQDVVEYSNPILPGFHPDPSICRVGGDFYVVNSSFQYFPGVPIYHSSDLIHWQQVGNVLNRASQLPLNGASSWLGIYAPTLRYYDGTFYMVTTNVGNGSNFYVTATNPQGPWSEPIALKQSGIDPSFYFEDGRCYFVSNPDNTITLCEINPKTGEQLSESRGIWRGTGGRYPEGPHIYHKDGYYYLLISEGGTELAHGLTIARSRDIYGPYESCPNNPIFTHCCRNAQHSQIQGTGHGDFVQDADGNWWIVFLAYRNFGGSYHHLGRETFLAPVEWKEGEWPVINGGKPVELTMKVPALPSAQGSTYASSGDNGKLGPEWIYIQNPVENNYAIVDGKLRLTAAGSLTENKQPTFVGRRQESPEMSVATTVDCSALGKGGNAGISVYQINDGHAEVCCEDGDAVVKCRIKSLDVELGRIKNVCKRGKVDLRIDADATNYHFMCRTAKGWQEVAKIECSLLSTEVVGGFTGVIIGLFAQGTGTATFTIPE
ncbi:MAG: glycoside hydrolase family 43 protein [Muribaculaceae bacterium]